MMYFDRKALNDKFLLKMDALKFSFKLSSGSYKAWVFSIVYDPPVSSV